MKIVTKRAAFSTLGCKVNQYDTEALQAQFTAAGYEIVDFSHNNADVYVINTCTVTSVSDSKSRQMIRRAHRRNPDAKIVVVGCLAQVDSKQMAAIPGVSLIVGTDNRREIARLIDDLDLGEQQSIVGDISKVDKFEEFDVFSFSGKTRGSVKIQDGCNQFCSYCKVPYARGPSRSRIQSNVLAQVEHIVAQGYREVVLTGVHLGAYGHDFRPPSTLAQLVKELTAISGLERIRISSVDPNEVDDQLIELVATNPKVCRHLHIPLQSGSDAILQKMRRRYTSHDFNSIVRRIHSADPDIAITTDLIVGFPGESPELFAESYDFLAALDLAKIHVFRFSPRQGTPAAGFANQVDSKDKMDRSHQVLGLASALSLKFNQRFIGRTVRVLVERVDAGCIFGLTDNYVHVSAAEPPDFAHELTGQICKVKIIAANEQQAEGILVFDCEH